MSDLDPSNVFRLGFSFAASRVLLSAVELDLFTVLDTPLTAAQIASRLSLHPAAVPDFPDSLVALNIIDRQGDGSDALYSNAPESAAFLSRSSPSYRGGMLIMAGKRLYGFWAHLTECLQTGEIQNEVHPRNAGKEGMDFWSELFTDEAKAEEFSMAMSANNTAAHRRLASAFDWSGVQLLVDIGGGPAQLSCEVAEQNPHVKCISMDLEGVTKVAGKNVQRRGMADRVEVVVGDFWTEEFPKADVMTMGMILHDYDEEKKRALLKKAYDSLKPGGKFIAVEMLIDNARRKNVGGLLMSLNMLVDQDKGFDYTPNDFDVWAKDVGFIRSEYLELEAPVHAVVAYK